MAKVRPHTISSRNKTKAISKLFNVLAEMKTKKEIVDFLLGLLTESEVLMTGRRVEIVSMLVEGHTYEEIEKELKVGTQTIQRTYQWLYSRGDQHAQWLIKKNKKCRKT